MSLKQTWPLIILALLSLQVLAGSELPAHQSALVIIDMQPEFIERDGHHKQAENQLKLQALFAKQVEVIEAAKLAQIPIIFVEFEGAGNTDDRLRERALDYDKVVLYTKNTTGMFTDANQLKQAIINYLDKQGIKRLIMIGANGGACVKVSIIEALVAGYDVYAYGPGIADFNEPEFIYPYVQRYDFSRLEAKGVFYEIDELEDALNFNKVIKL